MSWFSVLDNVASGGVLGLVGSLATGWLELKRTAQTNAHELALIEAQKGLAREQADAMAFAASQSAAASESGANVWPWVASFRAFTRPGLTWLLVIVASVLAIRAGAAGDLSGRVVFFAEMGVGWWFGSRSSFNARRS